MDEKTKVVVARKRTRRSAKAAGATFERQVADYLRDNLDDRIDRRVKTGALDKGDIANIRTFNNGRVAVEVKNTAKLNVGPHLQEAETERINDSALVGLVISKRHGIGAIGKQLVIMTVDDMIALIKGERPVASD
jgi:hypothetical protein